MRVLLRIAAVGLVLAGAGVLAWAAVVWQWQDPVTLVVNKRHQSRLADEYATRASRTTRRPVSRGPTRAELRAAARAYRKVTTTGDPIGRLVVPRLGLEAIVVFGTDTGTLKKGPGLDPRTGLPGEGRLAYVAGHRTTYGAPFSEIDDLRPGDPITFELPYGTFRYVVTGNRIVDDEALEVLRSRGREELALQACWPRFFASQRYIAYARPLPGS